MTAPDFIRLLTDCNLVGNTAQLSLEAALSLFRSCQQDADFNQHDALGVAAEQMDYAEFLEACAALAVLKFADPFQPIHVKVSLFLVNHFLHSLFSGNKLRKHPGPH